MKVSRKGARFVAAWEGFRACPYLDAVGVLTVGFGTTEAARDIDGCITERRARRWLRVDLNGPYLAPVRKLSRQADINLRQHEIDALASAVYNLGPGVLDTEQSTMARRLRSAESRSYEGRCRVYRQELPKWCKADGRELEGLKKRRGAEVRLACHADYSGRP